MDEQLIVRRLEAVSARIQALEDQVQLLSQQAGIPYAPPSAGIPPHVVALAKAGKKLDAVRELRGLGMSLVEASTLVDGL